MPDPQIAFEFAWGAVDAEVQSLNAYRVYTSKSA